MDTIHVDLSNVATVQDLWDCLTRQLLGGRKWGENLDALDDVLAGGFGMPSQGFRLVLNGVKRARLALGHAALADYLQGSLRKCHGTARDEVRQRAVRARAGEGPTLLDEVLDVIRAHGPEGEEAESNVVLEVLDE